MCRPPSPTLLALVVQTNSPCSLPALCIPNGGLTLSMMWLAIYTNCNFT